MACRLQLRTSSGVGEGIYAASAGQATYDHLAALAEHILAAGLPALVDATFLKRDQRAQFRALAAKHNVPFAVLDIQAAEATLRRRIAQRAAAGADASEANEAVLEMQLASREPLTNEEQARSYSFDSERLLPKTLRWQCKGWLRARDDRGGDSLAHAPLFRSS